MQMRVATSPTDSDARMLGELSIWALREADESPIRSSSRDRSLVRATARCNTAALAAYRISGSIEEGLEAGKHAFRAFMTGTHPPEPDLIPRASRRLKNELWIEARDGEANATA